MENEFDIHNEDNDVVLRRKPRNAESRDYDDRRGSERPPLSFAEMVAFNVPRVIRENNPDKYFFWCAIRSHEQDLEDNYDRYIDLGYRPEFESSHPEYKRNYDVTPFESRKKRRGEDNIIRRQGMCLMSISNDDRDYVRRPVTSSIVNAQMKADSFLKNRSDKYYGEVFDVRTAGKYYDDMFERRPMSR